MMRWLIVICFSAAGAAFATTHDLVPTNPPVPGALAPVACGALVAAPPRVSLLARTGWNFRSLFYWGPNSAGNVVDRAAAFASRFPKAKYCRLSHSPEPLVYFLAQIGQYDFRNPAPMVEVRHAVRTEWWFGGWVPVRQLHETRPALMQLSPVLIEGWRKLGVIGQNGHVDFTVSPAMIAERFKALTHWKVRRPRSKPDDDAILQERQEGFLQNILVADDTVDYLFVMPLLLDGNVRTVFQNYARYTSTNMATLFPGKEVDPWRGAANPKIFLELLTQSRASTTGHLFSAGPITIPPAVSSAKGREKAAAAIDQMVAWLARPDLVGRTTWQSDERFANLASTTFTVSDLVPLDLADWIAKAIADQLYRIGNIVEKVGFTEEALAFAREKAGLLQRYFRGQRDALTGTPALPPAIGQLPP